MVSFEVDWQLKRKNVVERNEYLLANEIWSDCSFIVGSEPNQKIFNVHKLFLAMSSPVFEAMFFGGMAEKNEPIPILDVQIDAFKALLDYIYTDKVNIKTFDQACELCYAAKKYMLPDLVEKCAKMLWAHLTGSNACKAYEFAKLFEEPMLMDRSFEIIEKQTEAVLTDPSFEEIEIGTLLMILDSETLNISSERDLFNAVHRWAKKECARKGLPEDNINLRGVIGPALQKIHFLTLTPLQFAEGPALAPLLSRDESFAILMNISNPSSSKCPMPDGFSKVVEPRDRPKTDTSMKNCYDNIAEQSDRQLAEPLPMPMGGTREVPTLLCERVLIPSGSPAYNNSTIDCILSFSVDRRVNIHGIQIPAQISQDNQLTFQFPNSYSELLYAHLLDSNNSRLTYTHCTSRVVYGQKVEINFNRPVYIQKSNVYKIVVILNKQGWYPQYTAVARLTQANGVNFTFPGASTTTFIESIIYSF